MEFLRHLRDMNYITPETVELAQAQRDPPAHGIGLRPARQPETNANEVTK